MSTLSLPGLTLTLPDGSTKSVDLGDLVASSHTDAGALASLALKGASAAGTQVPGWSVDSAQGSRSGDHTVPVNAAGVGGSVGLASYLVSSTKDTAQAKLAALTGTLGVGPLGTNASLGDHGLQTVTDTQHSLSSLGLSTDGLKVGLGDLLPADVLKALPLGTLTDLLSKLGIPLPAGVSSVLTQLTQISSVLDQAKSKLADLQAARNDLAGLLSSNSALAAAQQAVTDAQAAVTAAQQQLADATAQQQSAAAAVAPLQDAVNQAQAAYDSAAAAVASLQNQISLLDPVTQLLQIQQLQTQLATAQAQATTAQSALTAAQQALAPAQAVLDSANATLAAAQASLTQATSDLTAKQDSLNTLLTQTADPVITAAKQLVSDLTTTVNNLLTKVTGLINGLPDLTNLTATLTGLLKDAPLISVGKLSLGATSTADSTGGHGSVDCTAGSLTVLGKTVPAPTCADLTKAFAQVTGTVNGVLAALPTSGTPHITLDGLAQKVTQQPDGVTSAITPLHLAIPSISLADVTSDLVTTLTTTVQSVTSAAGATPLAVLPAGLMSAHALPVDVSTALSSLTQKLSVLPTGDALSGLRTLGLDLSFLGLSAASVYHPAAKAPTTTTPQAQPPASSTPTSSSTAGTPEASTLPYTGSDTMVLVAMALVLVMAGVHLEMLGRRRPTAG